MDFHTLIKKIKALSDVRGRKTNAVYQLARACLQVTQEENDDLEAWCEEHKELLSAAQRYEHILKARLAPVLGLLHPDKQKNEESKMEIRPFFESISPAGEAFKKVLSVMRYEPRVTRNKSKPKANPRDWLVSEIIYIAQVQREAMTGVTFMTEDAVKEQVVKQRKSKKKAEDAMNVLMTSLAGVNKAYGEKNGSQDDEEDMDTMQYALITEDAAKIIRGVQEVLDAAHPEEEDVAAAVNLAVNQTREYVQELAADETSPDDIKGSLEAWKKVCCYWWALPKDSVVRGTKAHPVKSKYYLTNVCKILMLQDPHSNQDITLSEIGKLSKTDITTHGYFSKCNKNILSSYASTFKAFQRFIHHARNSQITQILTGGLVSCEPNAITTIKVKDIRGAAPHTPKQRARKKRNRDEDEDEDEDEDMDTGTETDCSRQVDDSCEVSSESSNSDSDSGSSDSGSSDSDESVSSEAADEAWNKLVSQPKRQKKESAKAQDPDVYAAGILDNMSLTSPTAATTSNSGTWLTPQKTPQVPQEMPPTPPPAGSFSQAIPADAPPTLPAGSFSQVAPTVVPPTHAGTFPQFTQAGDDDDVRSLSADDLDVPQATPLQKQIAI